MFGIITINENELKVKDLKRYRMYYCGLCHELAKRVPGAGRITLTYDMTFLSMLLDGLYDLKRAETKKSCALHPLTKKPLLYGEATAYAADMNILLSYYNLLDKWHDSKNVAAKAGAGVLEARVKKISKAYPEQSRAVRKYIKELHELEAKKCPETEAAAVLTGEMLGTVFSWRDDMWSKDLYEMGFSLGRFIYFADALCDMKEDEKKGTYNIFLIHKKQHPETDIAAFGKDILTITAADAAAAYERLPVTDNKDILRNIIYSGIWGKVMKALGKKDATEGKR